MTHILPDLAKIPFVPPKVRKISKQLNIDITFGALQMLCTLERVDALKWLVGKGMMNNVIMAYLLLDMDIPADIVSPHDVEIYKKRINALFKRYKKDKYKFSFTPGNIELMQVLEYEAGKVNHYMYSWTNYGISQYLFYYARDRGAIPELKDFKYMAIQNDQADRRYMLVESYPEVCKPIIGQFFEIALKNLELPLIKECLKHLPSEYDNIAREHIAKRFAPK